MNRNKIYLPICKYVFCVILSYGVSATQLYFASSFEDTQSKYSFDLTFPNLSIGVPEGFISCS